MTNDDARAALQRLIEERGEDYAGLSRLLGRNAAYVQQYIKRGSPRRLAEDDRRLLARYFGVDEARLGGPAASRERGPAAGAAARRRRVGGRGRVRRRRARRQPYRLRSRLAEAGRARRAGPAVDHPRPRRFDGADARRRRRHPGRPRRRRRAAARRRLCAADGRRAGGEAARGQSGGADADHPQRQSRPIPPGRTATPPRWRSSAGSSGPGGGSASPDQVEQPDQERQARPIPRPPRKPMLGWRASGAARPRRR